LCAALLTLSPANASAQYFGQNKVQYETFDFEVMRTEHFDIYHYAGEREAVEQAARMAERWYARLSRLLDHELRGRQPLILYASHPDFQQTNVVSGFIGEGTGGVTEALRRRMVLPFTGSLAESDHVLGHEMVHAFQFDLGSRNTLRLPLWFIEGMAEYLSIGSAHAPTALWLRDAALRKELPGFDNLDSPKYFPYRFGHAAWAYLGGRFGDDVVASIFDAASRSGDALGAIESVTGIPIDTLSEDWRRAINRALAQPPEPVHEAGRILLADEVNDGGRINLAPSLSPDGRWIAFLSERDVFSIDLFLADAATGRVVRKLTDTATDPHLDSLQFLYAAGAWDAASRRLAFVSVRKGKPALTIVDIGGGDRQEIPLADLGEVFSPSWSPDGRSIVFAAIAGGVPDLYVYDLTAQRLRQLTDDLYTELQPAWSPDGTTVAFATDRFTTRLNELDFGQLRLAVLEVATGHVRPIGGFEAGKHINPLWSADGRSIYFVGEPDGAPNVYRVDLASQRIEPVTRVDTGVTGITALSPALSYASGVNRLAYSRFVNGGYAIDTIDAPPSGRQLAAPEVTRAAVLPPRQQPGGIVEEALQQARTPPPATYPVADYKAGLSLDFVGAGGGVSQSLGRYDTFVNGGVSLLFSDMLRTHMLGTTVQITGTARDFAGQLAYLNTQSRWGWGGALQQIPYRTGQFGQRLAEVDGRLVVVEEELLYREIDQEVEGFAQYPFSRAQRFELRGGLRRIGFSQELTTRVFSYATGQLLQEAVEDLGAPEALNLAETGAALVYDTSVFGATSPVLGQRSRLEVAPTFGSVRFTQALLDYRRYQSVGRPFTLALRGVHFGRYGGDAEDTRLSPLFLGYSTLVRGYDIESFDVSECVPDESSSCPIVDRLLGSRLLVANAELRFPLFGAFTREYNYGPIPIEGFVFADTGVAWTSEINPSFAGGGRAFVSSVGAGVRVNALGFLILELHGARPLDRPGTGWMFGFQLSPGF
jgi:Tol biopolymer transport system component